MPINASNALTLAHQLRVYTAEAANFSDMMDVIYVSQMIEKFTGYVDQIKQVSALHLDLISMCSFPHIHDGEERKEGPTFHLLLNMLNIQKV